MLRDYFGKPDAPVLVWQASTQAMNPARSGRPFATREPTKPGANGHHNCETYQMPGIEPCVNRVWCGAVAAPNALTLAELARLIHTLREPLGAFFINVELLESTQLTTEGQSFVKTLKGQMEKARAALDEIALILETGHTRSSY